MRSVSYQHVIGQASQLAFGVARPHSTDAATLNTFINEFAGIYWRSFWWPELMVTEQRQYRPTYSGGHAAGVEVYYPPAQAYYLSLKGPTSVPPATLTGGVWKTDYSQWIEVQPQLSGDDWVTGKALVAGDIRRNPADGKFYGCHTAHTTGGSFDATKFGVLIRWRPALGYQQTGYVDIDSVEGVYDDDPELDPDAVSYPFTLTSDILVLGDLVRPWIKFRRRIPSWSGVVHTTDEAYVAGDQVYFGSDFYRAKVNTSNLPSNTTDWEKLEFPYVLRSSVPRAAYAGWLDSEGQQDKSSRNQLKADRLNDAEIEEIESRQGQSRRLKTRSYR